jgi:predicted ribosome quality control (RQC) complex YloA/Tae2 family protein
MNNGVLQMVPIQQQQQQQIHLQQQSQQQYPQQIQQQYQAHNQQSSHVVQGNLNQIQNQNQHVRGRKYPEIELEDRTINNSNASHSPVIGTPVQVPVYPR